MAQSDPWRPDRSARTSRLQKLKLAEAPSPVIARAEQLCDLVDDADGVRPDRQDLIAALIFEAQPDGKALADAWRRYRTAPVHSVVLNETETIGLLDLTIYKRR